MDKEAKRAKHAAYMREYMNRNPEKKAAASARAKAKRLTDLEWAEAERKRRRERIAADPTANRSRAKQWQLANPERYKENMRKAHERNRAARIAKAAKWKRDNPEKAKASATDHQHRRRARKLGGDDVACRKVIRFWQSRPRFACALCGGRFLSKGNLQIDHIVPLAKGGPHLPSNLQPACKPCNLTKGAKINYAS
jgi:5-methylcytosine-specific restriction endonuclease McrA